MLKGIIYRTTFGFIVLGLVCLVFLIGCLDNERSEESRRSSIHPIPPSAKILFVSNMDTGTGSNEIYAMNEDGSGITRITYTSFHHRILGIDRTRRYIVATCVEKDTAPPSDLGDDDRKVFGF